MTSWGDGSMKGHTATRLALASTGLYIVLVTTGLTLQMISGIPEEEAVGVPGLAIQSVGMLGSAVMGSLIASRRGSPIGWILSGIAVTWGAEHFAFGYAAYALVAHPGSLPAGMAMALFYSVVFFIAEFGVALLFLMFPRGRLPSPRWRSWTWAGLAAVAILVALVLFDPDPIGNLGVRSPFEAPAPLVAVGLPLFTGAFFFLFGLIIASVVSLLLRLRRARGDERQQLKWFVYAAQPLPIGFGFYFFSGFFSSGSERTAHWIGGALLLISIAGIPVACAIAIFKYRLYEIDRIISRTVSYFLVVAVLAAVYTGGVFVVQVLIPASGDLAVAGSTLAAAALFSPLRRRVQTWVDRRFNRAHYEAARVLEEMATSMQGHLDLEPLARYVVGVVHAAVGPAHAEMWIRTEVSTRTS